MLRGVARRRDLEKKGFRLEILFELNSGCKFKIGYANVLLIKKVSNSRPKSL